MTKKCPGKCNAVRIHLNQGITLIEILLILMMLSVLAAITTRIYLNNAESPILTPSQQTILTIENAMKYYKLDNGFYPTTTQGISALVTKPTTQPIPKHWTQYLKTIPLDSSGKPFHYVNPGNDLDIQIYSKTPDENSSMWTQLKHRLGIK